MLLKQLFHSPLLDTGRKEQGRENSTKTPLQDAKQAKGHSKWQK